MAGPKKQSSDHELLIQYSELLDELKERGIVRSGNTVVSDYGEKIASEKLGLILEKPSTEGYDAHDEQGKRYQIKSRTWTKKHPTMQLGVIRNIESRPFDFLIVVIFNKDFSVRGMWITSIEIVKKYAKFSKHQNGHILVFNKEIINESATRKVI